MNQLSRDLNIRHLVIPYGGNGFLECLLRSCYHTCRTHYISLVAQSFIHPPRWQIKSAILAVLQARDCQAVAAQPWSYLLEHIYTLPSITFSISPSLSLSPPIMLAQSFSPQSLQETEIRRLARQLVSFFLFIFLILFLSFLSVQIMLDLSFCAESFGRRDDLLRAILHGLVETVETCHLSHLRSMCNSGSGSSLLSGVGAGGAGEGSREVYIHQCLNYLSRNCYTLFTVPAEDDASEYTGNALFPSLLSAFLTRTVLDWSLSLSLSHYSILISHFSLIVLSYIIILILPSESWHI